MATTVRTLSYGNAVPNITGSFREFVSFIRDGFESAGFLNTFPSGNINTSSVLPPTATNQERGYDVFQFNDAFVTSNPMFVRIGYRSSANATVFGVTIGLGEFHDTSGSLYSVYMNSGSNSITIASNIGLGLSSAQSQSCLTSGRNGNEVAFAMYPFLSGTNAQFSQIMFAVQRTMDWSGSIVPSGAIAFGNDRVSGKVLYLSLEDQGKSYVAQTTNIMLSRVTGVRPVVQPFLFGKTAMEPPALAFVMTIASESVFAFAGSASFNSTASQYSIKFGEGPSQNYVRLPNPMGGSSHLQNGNFAGGQILMRWA